MTEQLTENETKTKRKRKENDRKTKRKRPNKNETKTEKTIFIPTKPCGTAMLQPSDCMKDPHD